MPKCRLVPVSEAFSSSLQVKVQERLAKLVPRWRSIPVVEAAEYLGVCSGPAAAKHVWARAFRGWVGV
eukprot:3002524-Pyramimonas_sp.AAC.1